MLSGKRPGPVVKGLQRTCNNWLLDPFTFCGLEHSMVPGMKPQNLTWVLVMSARDLSQP